MRISLITPSFQQAEFLEETILSCHEQGFSDLEHIVVDGGSTDGSKDIIEKHADKFTWWCSETDKGQSHAINKGLAKAEGAVFNWLNSDDLLAPKALDEVSKAFEKDPELLVLGGRIVHRKGAEDKLFEHQTDASDPLNFFVDHAVLQPATFFRMDVVKAIGGVEERLRYVMDYELWMQFVFRYGTDHIKLISTPLAIFRLHDDSKTVSAHAHFLDEMASVLHDLCLTCDSPDLASILKKGYKLSTGLRKIPASADQHRALVRKMVFHFLLKWNGIIHQKHQFVMMKEFITRIDLAELKHDGLAVERYKALLTQLAPPSWTLFKLKRKFTL